MEKKKVAAIENRLNTGLFCDGFFTYKGADGWKGGIRTTGLIALNWKLVKPETCEVVFYYHGGQQIQATFDLDNFEQLVSYLN